MPKGGSGFRRAAGGAASSITRRGKYGYIDNADKASERITKLFQSLYRGNSVRFERDANGVVRVVFKNAKAQQAVIDTANYLSQNTVQYNADQRMEYQIAHTLLRTKDPVYIHLEDARKSAAEQLEPGHFKVRTTVQNEYRVNGKRISGTTFRKNSIRERFIEAFGESRAQTIVNEHHGGMKDSDWLNAANRELDSIRSNIYTRVNGNLYSSEYGRQLMQRYDRITRQAAKRRKK